MALRRRILLCLAVTLCVLRASGQTSILIRHANKDTAYIREYYRRRLILRAYESTKFNNFKFIDGNNKLVYKPNDHNVFGLGFNYRFIDINAGVYVPDAGKDINKYGQTRTLDIQPHLYVHRYIIDIIAQFYHGYYLENTAGAENNFPAGQVEQRPDIYTRNLYGSVEYVFNDKKFSYNAALYQNERQKKSAGSLIVGASVYHTDVSADSALTPLNVVYTNFFNNYPFNATHNTGLAVNGGYAYTLVVKKLFFFTEITTLGAGLNHAILSSSVDNDLQERTGVGYNLSTQLAAGYNSDGYFAGVTYIRLVSEDNLTRRHTWEEVNTGNFRLIVARRLKLKKALIPKSDLLKLD